VTYDGSAFSPSTVTIKKGDTVTWNDSSGQMWVASSPHPAHTGYDGTSRTTHCAPGYTGATPFDQCSPGATYTFTFDKVGSWSYHDHMNPSSFGTVVVTE
jgi:plastocyanin